MKLTQVKQKGNFLEINGRWRMELPGGVRARYQKRKNADELDQLDLYIDRREIANCHLGRTDEERMRAVIITQASTLLSSKMFGCEMQKVFEADVRNDARMTVHLSLNIDARGESIFELSVKEKTQIEICIQFIPPCTIEDLEEVLQKIKDKDINAWNGGAHPFGYEWEEYWRMAVCIAASIAPVDEADERIDFGSPISLDGGISVQLPAKLKPLKVAAESEDQTKIDYLPTDGVPTQADLERTDAFPFYIEYLMLMDENENSIDADELENRILHIKLVCKLLELKMNHLFSVMLCESMSPEGYKAIYLRPVGDGYVVDVLISSIKRRIASWVVQSDSDQNITKLIRIARGIYDRIKFANSSGEMIPFAHPQVFNLYHEHFTLVTSGSYTTRRDADFVGQSIRALMKEAGNSSEDAYGMMAIPKDSYSLDAEARELAKVFRLNSSLFDPYSDVEAMICIGMFADVRMFHALRSLAWTVSCKADRENRQLSDYRFEELKEIGEYIEGKDYLNYATESYCSGLCSHYDWRVFYVPDAYIGSDCEGSTDLRNLCGKENRSGNTVTISIPSLGIGGFDEMNQINRLINRNEETLESLEALREDLQKLLPVMKTIHDGFMEDRDRAEKLEGPLADALTAWCALAIAAKEPFYSEEASDQPETNAGLKGPLARPDDALPAGTASARKATGRHAKAATSQPAAANSAAPKPSGDVLDLGGATVIAPNQFAGNMTLKNVVIPEGVTEIGQGAFNSCMLLETVTFPKSLKKIGDFAFMSCRNLKRVDFSEGIEELGDHAFGATRSLKEVHFPESLKRVDRTVFGMGGDSPYATAYLSGRLTWQLYENSPGNFQGIYARHLVIDGEPYDDMQDYISTSKKPVRNPAPAKAPQASRVSQAPKASQTPQAEAGESAQHKTKYRKRMEDACKAGKSLQEMIEAARAAVASKPYSDKDGFEKAVQMLDRDATVTIPGKHFVLSGFGVNEAMMVDEIQKCGGIVHSGMVKMADYLVLYLNAPGVVKAMKALEWREKGAKNQIVSDYQLWQAMLGMVPVASKAAAQRKPDVPKAAASAPAEQEEPSLTRRQRRIAQQQKINHASPAHARPVQSPARKYGWIGSILPEGIDQAQAERELEAMSDADAANLIDTMKQMKSLEEQIAKAKVLANQAVKEQEEREKQEAEERERQERARREREETERRQREAQKSAERARIQKEISDLFQEMASLTGMLAVFKRKKLQKRIDELNEQLRRL